MFRRKNNNTEDENLTSLGIFSHAYHNIMIGPSIEDVYKEIPIMLYDNKAHVYQANKFMRDIGAILGTHPSLSQLVIPITEFKEISGLSSLIFSMILDVTSGKGEAVEIAKANMSSSSIDRLTSLDIIVTYVDDELLDTPLYNIFKGYLDSDVYSVIKITMENKTIRHKYDSSSIVDAMNLTNGILYYQPPSANSRGPSANTSSNGSDFVRTMIMHNIPSFISTFSDTDTLICNSFGDKRFSAKFAAVPVMSDSGVGFRTIHDILKEYVSMRIPVISDNVDLFHEFLWRWYLKNNHLTYIDLLRYNKLEDPNDLLVVDGIDEVFNVVGVLNKIKNSDGALLHDVQTWTSVINKTFILEEFVKFEKFIKYL